MAFCEKCGFQLKADSEFCGKCGAKAKSAGFTCDACGAELEEGLPFCDKCGSRVAGTLPDPPKPPNRKSSRKKERTPTPPENYTLTVIREARYICSAVGVTIIVNGIEQGKVASGRIMTVNLSSPEVNIEFKAWGAKPAWARLLLKDNANINIRMQAGAVKSKIVISGVTGAEILARS